MVHGPHFNLSSTSRVVCACHVSIGPFLSHAGNFFLEDTGTVEHDHRQRSENATVTK